MGDRVVVGNAKITSLLHVLDRNLSMLGRSTKGEDE